MSDTPPAPIPREAARIVLLDARDRVLLFRAEGLATVPSLWMTPGGGLERGETHEEGALRELWEETGLRAAALGPWVWYRRHVFEWEGRLLEQRERYYVLRVDRHEPTIEHFEEEEARFLVEHRWWTQAEIAGSREVFVPRRIAELLPPLIAGDYPATPIDVGV